MKNKPKTSQLRLRIFAGPNGSGKSTVIKAVSNFKTEDGHKIDLGYYINADDVSTASPEINKFRVHNRVKQNGHNVPDGLIVSRYYRAMGLMKEAAQITHQAFFFDNSQNDAPYILAAHFKQIAGKKKWDKIKPKDIPGWFKKYYGKKD